VTLGYNTQKTKSSPTTNRYEVISQKEVGPFSFPSKESMYLLDPIPKENEAHISIITS